MSLHTLQSYLDEVEINLTLLTIPTGIQLSLSSSATRLRLILGLKPEMGVFRQKNVVERVIFELKIMLSKLIYLLWLY